MTTISHGTDVALPAETTASLRAVLADHRFKDFVRLTAPSTPSAYRGRIYLVPAHMPRGAGGGWPWIRLHRCGTDLTRLLACHILAGASGAPQRYASGRGAVLRAVGLSTPPTELLRHLSIDLDGQHGCAPDAVVHALRAHVGHRSVLVTSSSGRAGRFRALMRLDSPLALGDAIARATQLLTEIGYSPRSGAVEIYPSLRNSRLAFGLGGCTRFDDVALAEGHDVHPLALAEALLDLPVVLLPRVRRLRPPAPHAAIRAAEDLVPSSQRSSSGSTRQVQPRCEASPAPQLRAATLWAQGVAGPGERDEAIWTLARDCRAQGLGERQAVARLQRWIDDGALDRSHAGSSLSGRDWQRRDVARRVRDAYRAASGQRATLHLTEREVVDAAVRSEEAAARSNASPAAIFRLLCSALPTFKAASSAGAPYLTLPHDWWREHGGDRCASLREASGVFVRVEPHRAQRDFGVGAHAARWRADVLFDRESPSRRVVLASSQGHAPGHMLLQARALVTCAAPREVRAHVRRWWVCARAQGVSHPALADTVEETLWRILREHARRGATPAELREQITRALAVEAAQLHRTIPQPAAPPDTTHSR